MKFSVVVPSFRRPAFLAQALASVEAARVFAEIAAESMEIIVVDDGHENDAQEVAARHQERGALLRYERTAQGPRAGAAAARNQGIRSAAGELVYLLDDDDAFLPHRFATSAPLMSEGGYEMVLEPSLRMHVNRSDATPFITGPYGDPGDPFRFLFEGGEASHITPGATSFRKEAFLRAGGYDESLRYGEDGELLLRMCLHARVALVGGDPVVRIAIHDDNSTRPDRLRHWHNMAALSTLYRKVRRGPWPDRERYVAKQLSGKLDFTLTRLRIDSPNYRERFVEGVLALWHFDWRCMTHNNLKSIWVWLTRSRTA